MNNRNDLGSTALSPVYDLISFGYILKRKIYDHMVVIFLLRNLCTFSLTGVPIYIGNLDYSKQ